MSRMPRRVAWETSPFGGTRKGEELKSEWNTRAGGHEETAKQREALKADVGALQRRSGPLPGASCCCFHKCTTLRFWRPRTLVGFSGLESGCPQGHTPPGALGRLCPLPVLWPLEAASLSRPRPACCPHHRRPGLRLAQGPLCRPLGPTRIVQDTLPILRSAE